MWLRTAVSVFGLGILVSLPFPSEPSSIVATGLWTPIPYTYQAQPLGEALASIVAAHEAVLKGRAIDYVIEQEGGYADHQHDPGGPTKYGITQKTARRFGYRGRMSDMAIDWAYLIYQRMWVESSASDISRISSDENAIQFFNAYVQHGPIIRKHWIPVDDPQQACRELNAVRMQLYRQSPNWQTFKKGWSNRIAQNLQRCNHG